MIAGFDRYYQIVKCFRDEDLRADRQPEFTQIDVETSFMTQHEIMALMEELIVERVQGACSTSSCRSRSRACRTTRRCRVYGSDKPDLRVSLELTELTDAMKNVAFKVFSDGQRMPRTAASPACCVPGGGDALSRGEIDAYTEFVGIYGAKGLAYIKFNEIAKGRDGMQSPIVKNLSDAALNAIVERTAAKDGDLIFFGAGAAKVVERCAGRAARENRPRARVCAGRMAAAVGAGLSDVRVGRGRQTLERDASSVYRAGRWSRRFARSRSRQRARQGARHGAQRLGDRRRLGAYPPPGRAVESFPRAQY